MKRTKTVLFILTALASVNYAFINSLHSKYSGTTFYSITDNNGGYNWTTSYPLFTNCQFPKPGGLAAYCTIVTKGGYIPTHNVKPSTANTISRTGENTLYR